MSRRPFTAGHTISQERVQLSARRPVRVQAVEDINHRIPPHDHEFCELALVRSGVADHVTSGGRRRLSPGDLVVVKPGAVHAYEAAAALCVDNVYYLAEAFVRDGRLLAEAPALCTAFLGHHLFPHADPAPLIEASLDPASFELVARELAWLAAIPDGGGDPVLMRACLLKVFAAAAPSLRAAADLEGTPLDQPVVQHALAASEHALAAGLPADVAAWAAGFGCSSDHFTRTFKRAVGETPSAFHQRRRLQHAADRLIHTDDALTAIALDLGFADSAHFARSFKAACGQPPSAWRRRFRAA